MPFTTSPKSDAIPLIAVSKNELDGWLEQAPVNVAPWVRNTAFDAAPGAL